ncbi:MAG: DegT/DnrJ/EryC1/StrS family aminotransferase [Cytophagales bacterium]|nr:DegT/DnrJ/EryC1/StrS family aminotransferase [Cytophagales bacterium]
MKIRLFKPSIGQDEINAIKEVFDRSWLGLGPKVGEFEKKWSKYINCVTSVAVNSGTAALHLALAAFNFPKGSKVLVPVITFISTASAALYNGLEPVFVDIDENTLGLDLEDLERKTTEDCVAIMAVHMGGHPLPMDKIMEFADRKNLVVIEDCAHCAGGEFLGKKLGTWGHIGCFSFEEKKSMTTGDGGMICSNDEKLLKPLYAMRWIGIDKDTWKRSAKYTGKDLDARHWYYEIALLGYKYNMNDLCASIGLVQLNKIDLMNANRLKAIKRYVEGLKNINYLTPLLPYDLSKNSSYHIFGLRSDKRDALMMYLKNKDIATGLHYTPLNQHPLFKTFQDDTPIANKVYKKIMTLPLFSDITEEEVDYVIENIVQFNEHYDTN